MLRQAPPGQSRRSRDCFPCYATWYFCPVSCLLLSVSIKTVFLLGRNKKHHFVPCAEITTLHLVWMFIQFVVCTHGLPRSIVSDREGQFVSLFWKVLCAHLNIMLQLSSGHHPEIDSQTEQENQKLEHYLRFYVNYLQDDWVQ